MSLKYRDFVEDIFYLKDKQGRIVKFLFNEVQADYHQTLEHDYPDFQGIRENILKGRQFGISTMWTGIFAVDFIMSGLGEIEITNSDIYSYKDEDTKAHFERLNLFLNSWLLHSQGGDYSNADHRLEIPALRKAFLKVDTTNYLETKNGAQIMTKTASAKVSGRGSTKQNIHWTECAYYPDTEILSAKELMTGAEEQVADNVGKIIRETTGRIAGDYFSAEYQAGVDGASPFKSRFLAWYTHKPYTTEAPDGWEAPEYYARLLEDGEATLDQCFWHYQKTRELKDKQKLREYPSTSREAFLYGGAAYFDEDALLYYTNNTVKPTKTVEYASAL